MACCFFSSSSFEFCLFLGEQAMEDPIVAFQYLQEGYPANGARLFTTCMVGGETTARCWNKTGLTKKVLCKKLFNMGTQPAWGRVAQFPSLEVFRLDWIKPWVTCSDIKLTLFQWGGRTPRMHFQRVLYYDPTVFKVSVHYYIKIRSEHKIREKIYRFILTRNFY